jgi:hypothetical protein
MKTATIALRSTVLFVVLVAACQGPVTQQDVPGAAQQVMAPLSIDPDARQFSLVPAESRMLVRVYRGGRLAQMGHNHIISSNDLRGEIYLSEQLNRSVFEVRLPVATMAVDKPELRAASGADFPGELDQDAIDGTRANMLGDSQLDAAQWPEILIRGRSISGAFPDLRVRMDIGVRSNSFALEVPVQVVSVDADGLRANARFTVRQTELGIEPFSVMLGALQVRDELEIELSLVARPAEPSGRSD